MQLDVDIEPTLRFPHMTSIDKQKDPSGCRDFWKPTMEFKLCLFTNFEFLPQTDRQTDGKRRMWAHRATCTGGLKKHMHHSFLAPQHYLCSISLNLKLSCPQYNNTILQSMSKARKSKILCTNMMIALWDSVLEELELLWNAISFIIEVYYPYTNFKDSW